MPGHQKPEFFASESAQTHHARTTTHYWHHAAQCYSLGVHYWRLGSRQGQQAGSAGTAGTAGRVSRDSRDIVSSPLPPPCSSPSAPPASPRRCCRRRRNWGSQWGRGIEGRRESEERPAKYVAPAAFPSRRFSTCSSSSLSLRRRRRNWGGQ